MDAFLQKQPDSRLARPGGSACPPSRDLHERRDSPANSEKQGPTGEVARRALGVRRVRAHGPHPAYPPAMPCGLTRLPRAARPADVTMSTHELPFPLTPAGSCGRAGRQRAPWDGDRGWIARHPPVGRSPRSGQMPQSVSGWKRRNGWSAGGAPHGTRLSGQPNVGGIWPPCAFTPAASPVLAKDPLGWRLLYVLLVPSAIRDTVSASTHW